MMGTPLTVAVKRQASRLRADLCGIGNIERWAKCPAMMSPQGILPQARSVIVCALHHGDATIEIGGQTHPQALGPYAMQYFMNDHLDAISYEMGRFLEDRGFQAVPIVSSNIWRYRAYKELSAVFSPDISHIYAAVAAGLAELGYSGLAITPQFGPRVRFVSVITDAPLEPDPLLPGNTLCDRCNLCVNRCPARALDKEVSGETFIEIEGRKYRFANKNLWRCSWGEHFGLDLNLPIPDRVDEKVLLDTMSAHGLRGGEMGQCLKFCLPAGNRVFDRKHTGSPRRNKVRRSAAEPLVPADWDNLRNDILSHGADLLVTASPDQWRAKGVDVAGLLENARGMGAVVARSCPGAAGNPRAFGADLAWAASHVAGHAAFFAARRLEDLGYDAAAYGPQEASVKQVRNTLGEPTAAVLLFVTSAPLPSGTWRAQSPTAPAGQSDRSPAERLKTLAVAAGADVAGIAAADVVDSVARQLAGAYEGLPVLNARSRLHRYVRYDPEITAARKHVPFCDHYVAGARSVIVLGARLARASVDRMGKPPAEAIGPYAFAHYQSLRTLQLAARAVIRELAAAGFDAVASMDLLGTGSLSASARGPIPDIFCNAWPAACAGLGAVGRGGFVINERFGANLRYVAIVTDAPLAPDAPRALRELRAICDGGCDKCLKGCTVRAHRPEATVELAGRRLPFCPVEPTLCDWAKRYALVAQEGFGLLGSTLCVQPPNPVTPDALAEALRQLDAITKDRPATAEMCAMNCPYARPPA